MININYDDKNSIVISDLIALSNLESSNIDTVVVSEDGDNVILEGKLTSKIGSMAVCGEEIVQIKSSVIEGENTKVTLERGLKGTPIQSSLGGLKFRTVVILDDKIVISWSFQDTTGTVGSTLFPVELGTGSIVLNDDPNSWSVYSLSRKYFIRNRKTMAFIFKGVNGERFLKFSTMVEKHTSKKTKGDIFKITLSIKSYLYKWYGRDIAINQQIKAEKPKGFFKTLFELNDNEVYYADGVTENSFPSIGNIHTKEFSTFSEILQEYCSNGVRFCFDRFERVKIFSDMVIDDIKALKTEKYNITSSTLDSSSSLIYNTIRTDAIERQTLMNYGDLDNRHVYFAQEIEGVISSDQLITKDGDDYNVNSIEITSEKLFTSVELKDYVLFRDPISGLEVNAIVAELKTGNIVTILPILQGDKDYYLFNVGKGEYLYNQLNLNVTQLNLHFNRFELPMVWKFTRTKDKSEVDSRLMCPLLPKVDGEALYPLEVYAEFGSADDLDVGEYAGYVENVDGIYGTWDKDNLLYNSEYSQFDGEKPPIFVLSNQVEETEIGDNKILGYTTFDNSDLEIEVSRPDETVDTDMDCEILMYNTKSINSSIDLAVDQEISRIGHRILEVENLGLYHLGDVLIVNPLQSPTTQENTLYENVLKDIRYRVLFKESQLQDDGVTYKNYIILDSDFPEPTDADEKYTWTRFPNWSIVYVQEMYFRGNPIITYTQEVNGFSNSVSELGETSKTLYDEQLFEFNSNFLDAQGVKLMMGYILNNFQATSLETTKFVVPLSIFNGIDIELLDVINFEDSVYTKIGTETLWLVTSVSCANSTNMVDIKLLNLNSKNTIPWDTKIPEVITYKPVVIPKYSHTGGEGDVEVPNDGQGGTANDPTLGQFWLSKVDTSNFRAKVDYFDGKYIYFKDFGGTEAESYKGKLFPVNEFGVNVDGEVIFVQSDSNYRAFIKKRQIYSTEKVNIYSELDVSFLITTSYTDTDGTLYSRKVNFGDGDNYLKVNPITGVKIVGDFVVGENNQTENNDLWQAKQKTKTFYQTSEPSSSNSYTLTEGDTWIDVDNGNKRYTYTNNQWVDSTDKALKDDLEQQIDGKIDTYSQSSDPSLGWNTQDKLKHTGDLWNDTTQNLTKRWDGSKWSNIGAEDIVAQELASSKKRVFTSTPKPPYDIGDFWITSMSDGDLYTCVVAKQTGNYVSTDFQKVVKYTDDAVATIAKNIANDKNKTFYQSSKPVSSGISVLTNGDTWIDTDDNNKRYTYNGSKWVETTDNALRQDLVNQIDGKINTYSQSGDPSSSWTSSQKSKNVGDLWNNTTTTQTKRWNGTSWENIGALDVIAQELAESKKTVFTTTPTTPYAVGDLWLTSLDNIGDLKVCIKARTSGSFVSSDFTLATKYTDDAVANEAKQQADIANNLLADIASDNKITPNEKIETQREWVVIQNEYSIIKSQADSFNIDTTEYTTSYNTLNSYITPILSSMTSTTTINGDTFKANFINYYSKKQILVSAISDKAKASGDNAQKDINTGRVVLNANTTINGDFKVAGGNIELDGDTKINGLLEVFNEDKGIISYNGVDEENSTLRVVLKGGEILFQEKIG